MQETGGNPSQPQNSSWLNRGAANRLGKHQPVFDAPIEGGSVGSGLTPGHDFLNFSLQPLAFSL
jgi:hypothetical protein